MDQLDAFLAEFADEAAGWFETHSHINERYSTFQEFFEPDNLRHAEWEDFQRMGKSIYALQDNALAYARAFGNPNHPIEYYRRSFEYLARGNAPLATRLNRVVESTEYGIKYLAESSIGEIAGQLFADEYMLYNDRAITALQMVGFAPEFERGASFGQKFVTLTETARPVVARYEQVVGPHTNVPIHIEVDQFFNWLYETQRNREPSASSLGDQTPQRQRVWLIAPGRRAEFWDEFSSRGLIGIGWDKLGDLRQYGSKEDIEKRLGQVREDGASAIDARACFEFAHEMQEGDFVFTKRGTSEIIGAGVVTSGYRFEGSRDRYKHIRSVKWLRRGAWTTAPRSRPRPRWSRKQKEASGWRAEPRTLPRKTLTEITPYATMCGELEILVGIDAQEAAGGREPLPIKEGVLDVAVEKVIAPLIEDGTLEDPEREAYIHQEVIPAAQVALIPEAVAEDPVEAVRAAFRAHGNLLHATEITKATDFLEEATPDDVREHVEDLLRGTDDLVRRIERFLDWGGTRPGPEGQSVGFNGTAVSFLLATDNPAVHAFCKPTIYQAAAEALLGEEHVVSPANEAKRIAHATRLYGSLARLLRQRYDLPVRDLFHAHTAVYFLADNPYYDLSWDDLPAATASETSYYWLNCNPRIWDPRTLSVRDQHAYTARSEGGNNRRVYENFERVRPGDLLVGYVTSPVQRIGGLFRITHGLHEPEDGRQRIGFEKIEDVPDGPTRDELLALPALADATPIQSPQGSLFRLSKTEFETIREEVQNEAPTYTITEATRDLFYDADTFEGWLDLLQSKKNVILQGPPGVGKTFVVKRLAYALIGRKNPGRLGMVQFHQSYAYEDFIRGFRPDLDGGFRLQDGVFFRFCEMARHGSGPHVFIIDEINRGNLSKIFGELMMLIESDKRGPDHSIPLAYQREGEVDFYVPENVYLIGMMNTADRSLAMVDYALRRRFGFVEMAPRFGSPTFRSLLEEQGAEATLVAQITGRLSRLNETIAEDAANLGPGFCIGHSYFCPNDHEAPGEAWYQRIIDREVGPLLREYWFDDREKAEREIEKLKG